MCLIAWGRRWHQKQCAWCQKSPDGAHDLGGSPTRATPSQDMHRNECLFTWWRAARWRSRKAEQGFDRLANRPAPGPEPPTTLDRAFFLACHGSKGTRAPTIGQPLGAGAGGHSSHLFAQGSPLYCGVTDFASLRGAYAMISCFGLDVAGWAVRAQSQARGGETCL